MLHPLPKNVFSSRPVSTLAITTHPPRCCEDHARLVADKLANGKEPKEAPGGVPAGVRHRDSDYGAQAQSVELSRPGLNRKLESSKQRVNAVE